MALHLTIFSWPKQIRMDRETTMIDEDAPKPKRQYMIGQPLDTMSVSDLAEAAELLRAEIGRLDQARLAKTGAMSAAEKLFSKK